MYRKDWTTNKADLAYEAKYLAEPKGMSIGELHSTLVDLIGYAAASEIECQISKTATTAETIAALKKAICDAAQSTATDNLTAAIETGDRVTVENGFAVEQEAQAEQQVQAAYDSPYRAARREKIALENAILDFEDDNSGEVFEEDLTLQIAMALYA